MEIERKARRERAASASLNDATFFVRTRHLAAFLRRGDLAHAHAVNLLGEIEASGRAELPQLRPSREQALAGM